MIWWTGFAPWELEFASPGSLISTFLAPRETSPFSFPLPLSILNPMCQDFYCRKSSRLQDLPAKVIVKSKYCVENTIIKISKIEKNKIKGFKIEKH